jgi:ATP/maltotriose-dependent transcriptional regulator MalT
LLTGIGVERENFAIPFSLAGVPEALQFIGREKELEEIHSLLASDGRRRAVVLHGLGGIGKTQTAVAYARRHKGSYSAVFWFNIQDETLLKQSFAKAAKRILQYHPSAPRLSSIDLHGDLNEVVEAVKAWLSEVDNTRWLAIYDNYDNPRIRGNQDPAAVDIGKFLPEADQGSVIVTTRSPQVRFGRSILMRKLLDVGESVAILSSMSRREMSTEGIRVQLVCVPTVLTSYR